MPTKWYLSLLLKKWYYPSKIKISEHKSTKFDQQVINDIPAWIDGEINEQTVQLLDLILVHKISH